MLPTYTERETVNTNNFLFGLSYNYFNKLAYNKSVLSRYIENLKRSVK